MGGDGVKFGSEGNFVAGFVPVCKGFVKSTERFAPRGSRSPPTAGSDPFASTEAKWISALAIPVIAENFGISDD